MLVTKQSTVDIDFHSMGKKILWMSIATVNLRVSKWENFHFWVNYPFKCDKYDRTQIYVSSEWILKILSIKIYFISQTSNHIALNNIASNKIAIAAFVSPKVYHIKYKCLLNTFYHLL